MAGCVFEFFLEAGCSYSITSSGIALPVSGTGQAVGFFLAAGCAVTGEWTGNFSLEAASAGPTGQPGDSFLKSGCADNSSVEITWI